MITDVSLQKQVKYKKKWYFDVLQQLLTVNALFCLFTVKIYSGI